MKYTSTMVQLFEKLDDLKSVFVFGQKIIPVVQSLIDFMKDTVPLLENINNSIAESTTKIPKATDHINDVTSATELATTEILDIVDRMSEELSSIENLVNGCTEKDVEYQDCLSRLEKTIQGNDEAQSILAELRQHYFPKNTIKSVLEQVAAVKSDAYNITLSLQVQDITSQQLAAVNHLIESVQSKLSLLISDLSQSELTEFDYEITDTSAFNPDAKYTKDSSNQELADKLINQTNSKTSQEEIDKLFK